MALRDALICMPKEYRKRGYVNVCLGNILPLIVENPLQQYMSTTIMKEQSTKICTDDSHHLWLYVFPTHK